MQEFRTKIDLRINKVHSRFRGSGKLILILNQSIIQDKWLFAENLAIHKESDPLLMTAEGIDRITILLCVQIMIIESWMNHHILDFSVYFSNHCSVSS